MEEGRIDMTSENEKCEKYGLHHDFVDGLEVRQCFACQRDKAYTCIKDGSIHSNAQDYLSCEFCNITILD